MKILLFSLAGLVALATGALAQVVVGPGAVKLGKPAPAGISSPEYQINNGPQKRYKLGTWLEVEIPYDTAVDDIDELTFNFVIGIENKLLDGSVTYINIEKGKDHYAVMYVTPRTLAKLTGGKPLTQSSVQNAWVTVSRQGQVLDQIAYKPSNIPNLPHLPGLVLNKNQTPFAPLYFDRYETIKATP
jgi:hypothetical protein